MGVKMAGLGGRVRVAHSVALILFIWSSCQILPSVEGTASTQCVQVGQVETGKKFEDPIQQKSKAGPFTIGGERFQCEDCSRLDWIHTTSVGNVSTLAYDKWGKPDFDFDKGTCENGGFEWNTNPFLVKHIFIDVCSTQVDIRTYLVRQNGNILRGWLYIEVELNDPTDEMEYIYVQVRDEAFNAIGEFVSDEREQCHPPPEKKGLISPTKYQVLPCSATGKREVKTANALFMAKYSQYYNKSLAGSRYLPKKDLTKGIYFTWRLNEYWCNRHQKIRVDANVWTTSVKKTFDNNRLYYLRYDHFYGDPDLNCGTRFDKCRLQRKVSDYLHPRWFGAADIKVDGQLECSTPVFDNSGALNEKATSSWIGGSSQLTMGEDYLHPINGSFLQTFQDNSVYAYRGCQVDPYPKGSITFDKIPTFGGRCKEHNEKVVSHDQTQNCTFNTKSPEFKGLNFIAYSDYSKDLLDKRILQCSQTCQEPNISNPADLELIQSFAKDEKYANSTKLKALLDFRTLTQSRLDARSSVFWPTRKYHGIICVICVMFIMPVSIFFIRYYKETFMSSHALGCGPWFWLHLLMPFAVLTLYLSGHKAMEQPIQNFGTSESPAGNFHRVAGKGFILVFCAMAALGVFRPVGRTARAVCCALHSVIGFSLYILSVVLVVNSTFIPGSPSVGKCDQATKLPKENEYSIVAKLPCVWLGIDIVFHCLMTVVQFAVDRRYKLERPGCGLPFIPILPADSQRDLVGTRFRKLMLLLYVILSLTLTLITTHQLFVKDDRMNCTLGVMSCDLSETRPYQKSSPFGCNVLALTYYNKFVEKYNIAMK